MPSNRQKGAALWEATRKQANYRPSSRERDVACVAAEALVKRLAPELEQLPGYFMSRDRELAVHQSGVLISGLFNLCCAFTFSESDVWVPFPEKALTYYWYLKLFPDRFHRRPLRFRRSPLNWIRRFINLAGIEV